MQDSYLKQTLPNQLRNNKDMLVKAIPEEYLNQTLPQQLKVNNEILDNVISRVQKIAEVICGESNDSTFKEEYEKELPCCVSLVYLVNCNKSGIIHLTNIIANLSSYLVPALKINALDDTEYDASTILSRLSRHNDFLDELYQHILIIQSSLLGTPERSLLNEKSISTMQDIVSVASLISSNNLKIQNMVYELDLMAKALLDNNRD